jgi:hypothetical protein
MFALCSPAVAHTQATPRPSRLGSCACPTFSIRKMSPIVYGGGTKGIMGETGSHSGLALWSPIRPCVIPSALIKIEDATATRRQPAAAYFPPLLKSAAKAAKPPNASSRPPYLYNPATVLQESEYGITTIVPDMHTRKRVMRTRSSPVGRGAALSSWPVGLARSRRPWRW